MGTRIIVQGLVILNVISKEPDWIWSPNEQPHSPTRPRILQKHFWRPTLYFRLGKSPVIAHRIKRWLFIATNLILKLATGYEIQVWLTFSYLIKQNSLLNCYQANGPLEIPATTQLDQSSTIFTHAIGCHGLSRNSKHETIRNLRFKQMLLPQYFQY